jgi:hypothetical protein
MHRKLQHSAGYAPIFCRAMPGSVAVRNVQRSLHGNVQGALHVLCRLAAGFTGGAKSAKLRITLLARILPSHRLTSSVKEG